MTSGQTPETGVPTCYRHPGRESYIRCQRCGRTICPDCMHDAAVGFHCPACVAEAAKSTRSGRTAYGGIRPTNASITSGVIVGINVAVWLAIVATGWRSSRLIDRLALLPVGECASKSQAGASYEGLLTEQACTTQTQIAGDGNWIPGVSEGAYWQLLTSAFTHVEVWHIGFNMLALWILGPQLEMVVGRSRFVALYLLSALAGSTLVYWAADVDSSTIGASGAIFGLMGALLVVALKVGGDVRTILVWIGINFVITFVWAGISWQGHLGGFLGGLVIAAVLAYSPRQRRTFWQVLGLSLFTLVLIALILARTAELT